MLNWQLSQVGIEPPRAQVPTLCCQVLHYQDMHIDDLALAVVLWNEDDMNGLAQKMYILLLFLLLNSRVVIAWAAACVSIATVRMSKSRAQIFCHSSVRCNSKTRILISFHEFNMLANLIYSTVPTIAPESWLGTFWLVAHLVLELHSGKVGIFANKCCLHAL